MQTGASQLYNGYFSSRLLVTTSGDTKRCHEEIIVAIHRQREIVMSRKLGLILATCISMVSVLPANADSDAAKGALMIPVKAVAFVAGVGVGTPIAIVRKSASNTKTMTGDISGKNSDNPILVGTSGLVVLPFALFKGGLEGMYYGVANSWKNSSEHPFSSDSFSLGDMD